MFAIWADDDSLDQAFIASVRHLAEQHGSGSVAPVNETDTVLLPEGLDALKRVARLTDLKN